MLDEKSEHAVAEVCDRLQEIFATRLITVALYGSAAGADYVAGVSDINLVVVLDEVGTEDLRALRAHVAGWQRKRIATPLLLDRRFLANAVDVFPMELHDIRAQHKALLGEDVLSKLNVHDDHLRFQCEHEARGKLLRLRELYLEIGSGPKRLKELMVESLKTFLIIMRNLSRVRGLPAAVPYEDVLRTFQRTFDCSFPTMSLLLQIKLSKAKWQGDVEATFDGYLQEVQQLVRVIDQIPQAAPSGPTTEAPSHPS